MGNPTLLLNLQPGRPNTALLQVAAGLAARLDARVIGVAALQPLPTDWTSGDYVASNFTGAERSDTDAALGAAEAEFHLAFPGPDGDWRSHASFAAPSAYVVTQMHRADLVLTGTPPRDGSDELRALAGDLVMQGGRPVLVVPPAPAATSLDRVMLAWKDTPESRRAASDALPLLIRARYVVVVTLAADEDLPRARRHLNDVAHWLAGHGVVAETRAALSVQVDATQLESLARSVEADLVVSGAYGHSQMREWAFGGVTRSLLEQERHCTLLAH